MNGEIIILPKLKSDIHKEIIILDDDLPIIYDISSKRFNISFFISFLVFIALFVLLGMFDVFEFSNDVKINYINVLSYDLNSMDAEVYIVPSSEQTACNYEFDGEVIEGNIKDNKCYLNIELGKGSVSFVNDRDVVSDNLEIDDYVVDFKMDKKYYFPIGYEMTLGVNKVVIGDPDISWVSLSDSIQIFDGKLKAQKNGTSIVRAMVNGEVIYEAEIVVTDTIVAMPNEFDVEKGYLPCDKYSLEDAQLLDEILEYRIKTAGYQTRAGAVAAARFLTLEFPYRIAYYWETGRLNNTGKKYVDGEGRYYHKGLYLHESKFESIEASALGPKIWGCSMKCYEDDPPYFYPGRKYPNGLDCSGFVSWVLYNAGFDVGDRGAGESPTPFQLTDLGEFKTLTSSLIKSGKIKPGDLFNYWGHISILVGEDKDNYYIAESLNTLGGVVVKKYSKKKVMNTFKFVVLMDDLYKEDGNLTDLWY